MKSATALKEGMKEAVEEKKDAPKHESKSAKKAKAKRARKMHIERANGGFIVNHEFDPSEDGAAPAGPMPPHVIPDMAGLHAHMDENMGEETPEMPPK